MDRNVAPWVADAAFAAGAAWRVSAWLRHGLDPAARSIGAWPRAGAAIGGIASTAARASAVAVIRSFVLGVLVQRRLLRESAVRCDPFGATLLAGWVAASGALRPVAPRLEAAGALRGPWTIHGSPQEFHVTGRAP